MHIYVPLQKLALNIVSKKQEYNPNLYVHMNLAMYMPVRQVWVEKMGSCFYAALLPAISYYYITSSVQDLRWETLQALESYTKI